MKRLVAPILVCGLEYPHIWIQIQSAGPGLGWGRAWVNMGSKKQEDTQPLPVPVNRVLPYLGLMYPS